jgi:hypothetical protein
MSEAPQTKGRFNLRPLFAVNFLLIVFLLCLASPWPPTWAERRQQRQKVMERVQAVGGWDALKRDCLSLTESNEAICWYRGNNSFALPPALAALRPQSVDFVSPKLREPKPHKAQARPVRAFRSEIGRFVLPELPTFSSNTAEVAVLRIQIFGSHSTGGHSTPYSGLEIISGPGGEDYRPRASRGATGNRHTSYRKVEEGIYEVY